MSFAWLIYDKEGAARNQDYIDWHFRIGREYGITFELKLAEQLWPIVRKNSVVFPDFAIVRTIQPALSEELENRGIPVFNSSFVSKICNHKGKTIDYIKQNTSVPVIQTASFSVNKLSEKLLVDYRGCVIKSVDGHGGKQVFRMEDDWKKIQEGIGTSDFIIQPYVRGPGKDVRVYVIGNQIVGAVERTAKNGFKSNFSLGGAVKSCEVTGVNLSYVREICHVISFGMVGIDFIINEKEQWIFNEIEDVVGARMLYQCQPDCHLLERYFAFILDYLLHC